MYRFEVFLHYRLPPVVQRKAQKINRATDRFVNGDWDDHSAKKGNVEASNVIFVESTGLGYQSEMAPDSCRERPYFFLSTYLNRTSPWDEALGGPAVRCLKRVARMHMSGVRIPGNDESFLCATMTVKGVVLVIETFDKN